jgi:hypothetical protein
MLIDTARFRTILRTNDITGGLLSWGYRHYLTALAEAVPDACADIPKVPGAGGIYKQLDGRRYQLMNNEVLVNSYYGDLVTAMIQRLNGIMSLRKNAYFTRCLRVSPERFR